jgi:hypothetical protein
MPYTRPDRKGLPPPPPEEEEEMPRSESYLRLSDLGSQVSASSLHVQITPTQSTSQSNNLETEKQTKRKIHVPELTPPMEMSNEHSPAKSPSTKSHFEERPKTPSRRNSSSSPVQKEGTPGSPPQKRKSVNTSPRPLSSQSVSLVYFIKL